MLLRLYSNVKPDYIFSSKRYIACLSKVSGMTTDIRPLTPHPISAILQMSRIGASEFKGKSVCN